MIITRVFNFQHVFILLQSNLWRDMNLFYLHLVFLSRDAWCPLSSVHWCCILIIKKLATIVEGNPKAPFSIVTTPMCRGGRYSFPGLLYFNLDPYLIMLSVKQGGIKYHFLSLWYDSTWDWTQVSRAIGEQLRLLYS